MRKALIIGGAAAVITLSVGGGVAAATAQHDTRPTASASPAASADPKDDGNDGRGAAPKVSLDQAERTARDAVSDGRVTEAELDREGGRLVWEFEVVTSDGVEHEVTVDANGGKVLDKHVDRDDHEDD